MITYATDGANFYIKLILLILILAINSNWAYGHNNGFSDYCTFYYSQSIRYVLLSFVIITFVLLTFVNLALYLDYEFPNPCIRCGAEFDSFRWYWSNGSFVNIIIFIVVSNHDNNHFTGSILSRWKSICTIWWGIQALFKIIYIFPCTWIYAWAHFIRSHHGKTDFNDSVFSDQLG